MEAIKALFGSLPSASAPIFAAVPVPEDSKKDIRLKARAWKLVSHEAKQTLPAIPGVQVLYLLSRRLTIGEFLVECFMGLCSLAHEMLSAHQEARPWLGPPLRQHLNSWRCWHSLTEVLHMSLQPVFRCCVSKTGALPTDSHSCHDGS